MEYSTDHIIKKLQAYNESKRKLALLEFELANISCVSPQEMLEAMAFRSSSGERASGTASPDKDKLIHIALNYNQLAEKKNQENYAEILNEWHEIRTELRRMDLCLSLLDEQLERVLRCVYFEKKTWREIEEETGLSRRTIIRRKQEALGALADMYSYTQKLIEK